MSARSYALRNTTSRPCRLFLTEDDARCVWDALDDVATCYEDDDDPEETARVVDQAARLRGLLTNLGFGPR